MKNMHPLPSRRAFAQLSGGIFLSLTLPSSRSEQEAGYRGLAPSYLGLGLTAMARADHWFDAHWGAAVIAAYYLCRDNALDADTLGAIDRQLQVLIERNASAFEPFAPDGTRKLLVEELTNALTPVLPGGLRDSHAVIYTSLATRALTDAPQFASPQVITGIREHIATIGGFRLQRSSPNAAEYDSTQSLIEAAFESIARHEAVRGRPEIARPNFTHWLTHSEALWNLDAMGYVELARSGHAGHRVHLDTPAPEIDANRKRIHSRATLGSLLEPNYWNSEVNQALWKKPWNRSDSRNGDWIASGHLFKILYAFSRLARNIEDKALVEHCGRIVFERYMNPDVSGG